MKRISFGGNSIVTGDAVAAALLTYVAEAADAGKALTLDLPVLEEDGTTSVHTLVLAASGQLDVGYVVGGPDAEHDEEAHFPVPPMPPLGIEGKVEDVDFTAGSAEQYDSMMDEIDDGLGSN